MVRGSRGSEGSRAREDDGDAECIIIAFPHIHTRNLSLLLPIPPSFSLPPSVFSSQGVSPLTI